jgi:hypothetical protein
MPLLQRQNRFFVKMERNRRSFTTSFGLIAAVLLVLFFAFSHRTINDGRTPGQEQQIADALFNLMRSPAAQELDDIKMEDIKADDPRIPPVIRSLHPVRFIFSDSYAVVYCAGTPAEYTLRRGSRNQKIWTLYASGPGGVGANAMVSFQHD